MPLAPPDRVCLLDVARKSIGHGLDQGRPLPVAAADFPPPLREIRASFVTLEEGPRLRGCIGTLEAHRPLVEDVSANAFAAAFEDPRFPRVRADELDGLSIHISILTPPMPLPCASREELLRQLRPGVDGLILAEGWRRATFLPAVWEDLPEPRQFLAHLLAKGGWPPDYWSPRLLVQRYEAEYVG